MKQMIHFSPCVCLILSVFMFALAQKPELSVQTGHSIAVDCVTFSRDGRLLASAGHDDVIKLWDAATGAELRAFKGHGNSTFSSEISGFKNTVVFSPDSKTLATGSQDTTVKLWDVATGGLRILRGHAGFVSAVAFSPDGKTLVSGSQDNTVKVWDVATGAELRTIKTNSFTLNSIAFSPDGRTVASGSQDYANADQSEVGSGVATLWDVATGAKLHTLISDGQHVRTIVFSADGKTMATGTDYATIMLWDVATGAHLRTLGARPFVPGRAIVVVDSVAFSPDGKTLVSGSRDEIIALWDVASGSVLRRFSGHSSSVTSVAFSHDGKILASGSEDRTIKLWNGASGLELRTLKGHPSSPSSIVFSPDGKTLADDCARCTARLWDISTGTMRTLEKDVAFVSSGELSPDGKMLARIGDNTVKLIEVATRKELYTIRPHSRTYSIAFSPDSRTLATGSNTEGPIELWDVSSGAQLPTLQTIRPHFTTYRMAFSPNGNILANHGQGPVELWDVSSGVRLPSLAGDSSDINLLTFSPDCKILAGATQRTIKLWDVTTGAALHTLRGQGSEAREVVYIFEIIHKVAFSPDSKTVASGNDDSTIRLWDVATGRELHTLLGHGGYVYSLAFSLNNRYLVSGSADASIKVWEVGSGKELASLISFDEHDWIVVTPDGLFDGSPAAWKKLLWRFNSNTFDYAPVEAFFGDFFYPGLLAEIFAGKSPKAQSDISQKDRRQPGVRLQPAISQVSDAAIATRNLALKIDVSEAVAEKEHEVGSGAQDVRLFRNGSLVKVWRDDVLKGKSNISLEVTLPIVAGENEFTAYAFNHDNIKSSDATLNVTGAESPKRQGTAYVLAVGVNRYRNPQYNLKYAVADALEFSGELKLRLQLLKQHEKVEVIPLHNKEATKRNIIGALRLFSDGVSDLPSNAPEGLKRIRKAEPEDALIVFFAGHGTALGERFYLLPHDYIAGNKAQLEASAVSDVELNEALEQVGAGKLLMVIDACQSGQALGGEKEGRGPMNSKGLAQLAYDKGMYILTAAQSYQAALEVSRSQAGRKIEHGLLTFALLEGLTKATKDTKGQISERNWMNYAVERVPLMQTEEMKKRNVANKARRNRGKRGTEVVFDENDKETDPEKRNVQRPRVFYRRELEVHPLIVARP